MVGKLLVDKLARIIIPYENSLCYTNSKKKFILFQGINLHIKDSNKIFFWV